ncbi:rhomboid family intramembrane serine protease [Persicimonas caeni]|uniref:Rhomboid family intramembrane serine protease n=1 Tax=Persicimonas caeni TaxID=2292766 RepID=A0A4Y6PYS3_PERCE|nr:rhomboid family intramembrane serine protease [Persicimonas caeni]QDG53476.1 rhomboid family intramembrane serine protease [Persicimonas caeni]QED34697.1 rhomboid family intramembrane serine protease [Persicimonas caeni]
MRQAPPLARAPHYPVTAGVGLLALGTTLLWFAGYDIDALTLSYQAFGSEPWRLVTSALPHIDILHILFNLYWLWVFGTYVEEKWGHPRTFLLFLVLAAGSGAAEYAVFSGGVGLSGVGYGLFGLLWIAGKHDPEHAEVVDSQTAMVFIGWFFLCIAATAVDAMNVANVAHGAGAVLGGLVGWAVGSRGAKRIAAGVATAAAFALMLAAGGPFRPAVNITGGGLDRELAAHEALEDDDYERALDIYDEILADYGDNARWHFNRGVTLARMGRYGDALDAYEKAAELEPGNEKFQQTVDELRAWMQSMHLELQ